jgi:predicted NUDIX family NTP pyrophosphohydrolase
VAEGARCRPRQSRSLRSHSSGGNLEITLDLFDHNSGEYWLRTGSGLWSVRRYCVEDDGRPLLARRLVLGPGNGIDSGRY